MFGEEPLKEEQTVELTLDDKDRILIPDFTKREKGDVLVVYKNKDNTCTILNFNKFEQVYDYLKKMSLDETVPLEERKINRKKILNLCKSVLKKSTVDAQGRITIGNLFKGRKKVLVTGKKDYLIIKPIDNQVEKGK